MADLALVFSADQVQPWLCVSVILVAIRMPSL